MDADERKKVEEDIRDLAGRIDALRGRLFGSEAYDGVIPDLQAKVNRLDDDVSELNTRREVIHGLDKNLALLQEKVPKELRTVLTELVQERVKDGRIRMDRIEKDVGRIYWFVGTVGGCVIMLAVRAAWSYLGG